MPPRDEVDLLKHERRIGVLEKQHAALLIKIDGLVDLKEQILELTALKNQITGMVNLVRFVGYGGIVAIVALTLKLMFVK